MNKNRMLVALVVADIFLAFAVIGTELFFNWSLPAPLREHAVSQYGVPSNVWEVELTGLWGASIGCTVAAWIGLLNYWRLARVLYLVGWGTWTLLILLSGPSVMTSMGAMLSTLESVVGGMIIGLVYFSDLSQRFEGAAVLDSTATDRAVTA